MLIGLPSRPALPCKRNLWSQWGFPCEINCLIFYQVSILLQRLSLPASMICSLNVHMEMLWVNMKSTASVCWETEPWKQDNGPLLHWQNNAYCISIMTQPDTITVYYIWHFCFTVAFYIRKVICHVDTTNQMELHICLSCIAENELLYFLYSGRVVLKLASVLLLQEHINKSKRFWGTVNAKLSLFKTTYFKQDLKPSKNHENKVSVFKFHDLLNSG